MYRYLQVMHYNMRYTAKKFANVILIVCISCTTNRNGESFSKICNNKLDILISSDSIPNTELNLYEIRNNTEDKIKKLYTEPFCNNLKFNVQYQKDSLTSIPLTLNMLYSKDCSLPPHTPRLLCHVLINNKGQLLLEAEVCEIDSIGQRIYDFYDSDEVKRYSSNDYNRVSVSLLWYKELDNKYFIKTMDEILKGYFDFASNVSNKRYGKAICELSKEEVNDLKRVIPFNLRTDFNEEFKIMDLLLRKIPEIVDSAELDTIEVI